MLAHAHPKTTAWVSGLMTGPDLIVHSADAMMQFLRVSRSPRKEEARDQVAEASRDWQSNAVAGNQDAGADLSASEARGSIPACDGETALGQLCGEGLGERINRELGAGARICEIEAWLSAASPALASAVKVPACFFASFAWTCTRNRT